jgi:hypothetical protein
MTPRFNHCWTIQHSRGEGEYRQPGSVLILRRCFGGGLDKEVGKHASYLLSAVCVLQLLSDSSDATVHPCDVEWRDKPRLGNQTNLSLNDLQRILLDSDRLFLSA